MRYARIRSMLAVAGGALLVAAAPDLAHGKRIAETCVACHGGDGLETGTPVYHAPKLRGQHPDYLERALRAYRSGERKVAVMREQVAGLSTTDMRDVSAYLAGSDHIRPQPLKHKVPVVAAEVCGACHGETGLGTLPETPLLSGQRVDYLTHSLAAYRNGERANSIMRPYASRLTKAQVAELATYFAAQGALGDLE